MLSPFLFNDKNLYLDRYPSNQVNRSLQAWDATDEYFINYLSENSLVSKESKLLIFNDDFGAIALNYSKNSVYSVTDSFISQQGLQFNAKQNHISMETIKQLSSLEALPNYANIILFKIPKSKNLLIEQLIQIQQTLTDDVIFIAGDKAKNIQNSTLKVFEKYLGTTTTSLAYKKARLVFCKLDAVDTKNTEQQLTQTKTWPLENTNIMVKNHANVFARDKLDIGARAFIEHLPKLNIQQAIKVVDLGCGNGVVGLSILKNAPDTHITFIDESYMAVQSAKENVTNNFPNSLNNCEFIVNDCLTDFESHSADLILCNPPFHQQNATTDHIAWQMFKDSYKILKKGGELRIVGNRQLGYHIKLKRIFGNEKLIASNQKFVILSAIKR